MDAALPAPGPLSILPARGRRRLDKRAPVAATGGHDLNAGFAMPRTFMIRHGKPQSTWGELDADPDPGLDEAGRAQAEAAADHLMTLAPDVRPDRVFSSPLRRCRETAEPFARRLGVTVEIDLRFGDIPTPAGLSQAERGPWLREAFTRRWDQIVGDLDYEVWRRSVGAALVERAGAAVFSHFVAINAAVACANGTDAVISLQPDHAAILVFDIEDGRPNLVDRGAQAATSVL
jgi:broad specificity phosphatase PhoE